MTIEWQDHLPIYRQLKERVSQMILDGRVQPGDAIPSVRQVAAEYRLNPITVSRAFQEMADEELIEKRRGLGMYVKDGARERLLQHERERFLNEEWPAMLDRMKRLGIDVAALLTAAKKEAP